MSTINFGHRWITVWIFDGSVDYEVLRTEEPLEVATLNLDGDTITTQMGFDVDEILHVIQRSEVPVDVYLKMDVLQATRWVQVMLHEYEEQRLDSQGSYRSTDTRAELEEVNDFLIDINDLFWDGAYHTFAEAIQEGYKGLYLIKGGFDSTDGIGQAENIEIQVEGDWSIQRPGIRSLQGGEMQNINEPAVFSWQHNGSFDQTGFELRYRVRGSSTWTYVDEETSNQSYTLPANELSIDEYEWQVRTRTDYDYESEWSPTAVFVADEATPTPTIIEPPSDGVVETADLHIEWEAEEQDEYEVEVLDDGGNVVWSGSGGTSTSLEIEDLLDNGETYTVRVRVNVDNGIWSSWAESTFEVDYTEPANPTLTFVTDDDKSTITVYIENPTPTGTEPNVTTQDLYRRRKGESDWIKLVEHLQANDFFVDYTPAHGTEYEYYVRVRGDNETRTNSDIFTSSVKVKHVLLSLANNLTQQMKIKARDRSFDVNLNATKKMFSGRKRPVVEFGETINNDFSQESLIKQSDYNLLEEMMLRQETLLYRDGRGRKHFVAVSNLSVTDEFIDRCSVNISYVEVDYHEGVD